MNATLLIDPGAAEPHRREAETLLAAVLSLMTDHALACCDGHRPAVAQKIAACFLALSLSAGLSAGSRSLALRLHARWLPAGRYAQDGSDTSHLGAQHLRGGPLHHDDNKVLWHTTPELIQ